MKRIVIFSSLAVVLLLTAAVVVQAKSRGRYVWCNHPWRGSGPASYLDHELTLNDAQRAQIRSLWQTERPIVATRMRELLSENKEMNEIAASAKPDPAEVQKIANREANTIAALLMEKARLQSNVYSILNPEQRAKAEQLQKNWELRLDHLANHLEAQAAK